MLTNFEFFEENLENRLPEKPHNYTLQFWLKISQFGTLIEYCTDNSNGLFVDVDQCGRLIVTSIKENNQNVIKTLRGGINNNKWVHLSVVSADDSISVFVNGSEVGCESIELKQKKITGGNIITIGRQSKKVLNFDSLEGEFANVVLWGGVFEPKEILNYLQEVESKNKYPVILNYTGDQIRSDDESQEAVITIENNSDFNFKLSHTNCGDKNSGFPDVIYGNDKTNFTLKNTLNIPGFNRKAEYECSAHPDASFSIEVHKSIIAYESWVKVEVSDVLEREITPEPLPNELEGSAIEQLKFRTNVTISENLVIVNAKNLNGFVNQLSEKIGSDKIIQNLNYCEKSGEANSSAKQIIQYNQSCQIFNSRIQKKPLAIVNCACTEDVRQAYLAAMEHNLPISVRSGGHDHEGECSGTNTVLIDLMGLCQLKVDDEGVAEIGPGNRFITLTTALANLGRMLPHGTCATVAIPGFIMGGGWGPWTRKYGMCCESLQKAEIILGNGEIEVVDANNKPELLWALKGGGGMSYGIVTKFFVKTFPLPNEMIKFELEWNLYDPSTQELIENIPTNEILTRWEEIICDSSKEQLTGTNLKINGKPLADDFNFEKIVHNCLMYGYWDGSKKSLETFVKESFTDKDIKPEAIRIDGMGGLGSEYGKQLMGSWDRESFDNVKLGLAGKSAAPFPPDLDEPAPHKLTSRLVDAQGLGDKGHEELLMSLTSSKILPGSRELGLFSYVTLGAIDGGYYQTMQDTDKDKSAFPYKDKLYTIQYQTWWNNELTQKEQLQNNKVYSNTNRALDWIEACRDFDIPNTSGAFISFKDSSIPTQTYFSSSYQCLVDIKNKYSKDEFNHFRKRKTII